MNKYEVFLKTFYIRWSSSKTRITFEVYYICIETSPNYGNILFMRNNYDDPLDHVENIEDAQIYLDAIVTYDDLIYLHFHESEYLMSKRDYFQLNELIKRLFEISQKEFEKYI